MTNDDTTPGPIGTRRDDSGFTLVEAVIAMALLLLATVTIYTAFGRSGQEISVVQGMVESQADARGALAAMSAELRNAFTGVDTTNRIEALSATGITFYTADRDTPMSLKKVIYRVTGTTLERSVLEGTDTDASATKYVWSFPGTPATFKPVLTGLTNASGLFVYYGADNVVISPTAPGAAANVRLVEVTLQVRDPKAKTTQKAETYKTTVRLRGAG
jgi:Tfp pilus assembly protein PilW